ncbi:MAG: tRNA (adenosine(37)-N6)-dimethylallyltransferase MiaA [Campylobacterota bacterium]|nr:tRNA (adenosine(37)-N6)-dimethylallyltransferase MiaA [Campylobacterota bacterium]
MYKEIAIIAPTASGKTQLSIELAHKLNAIILSLDSLSIYKEIDIASAKPSIKERDGVVHFGIDKVYPNYSFDVIEFIKEYKEAKSYAIKNNKNLIIVGGTGFYLKSMCEGLSNLSKITDKTKDIVKNKIVNIEDCYNLLYKLDPLYMNSISSSDKYRIEKALAIYIQTDMPPSEYFSKNKPQPIVTSDLKIFEIETNKDILRDRIKLRTKKMIEGGIIDEVISLEKKYTRLPNCMHSIGIIETLDYLDGKIDKKLLEEKISVHTNQLAKRQRTFNKSQFSNIYKETLEILPKKILSMV